MSEQDLYHPVTIQNTLVEGNLFLAPLAGYTDLPFRSLCVEMGANMTFTEMVSIEGLFRKGEKTFDLLKKAPNEEQYAVQLFMGSTDSLQGALEQLQPYAPTFIDINSGCPVSKVTKTGAGSSMMKNPSLITEVVRMITDTLPSPVSVKFRLGWDANSLNYLEFAQAALDGGASMLTLHARTRSQGYAPFADWTHLKRLKEYCITNGYDVPIFGSGDLFHAEDAKKMLQETGIDGVMFARGAMGNPFIFQQAKELLCGKEESPISLEERSDTIMRHLDLMIEHYGEKSACIQMRKHTCSYLKGIPNTASIKQEVVKAFCREEYQIAIERLQASC